MNKYSEPEEIYGMFAEKPIDYVGIFMKYFSYWKWFILSVFICVSVAVVYLYFTLPKYQIATSILFKDEKRGGGDYELTAFKEMGILMQRNNADNEIELLKKSLIAEKTVRTLGVYADYYQMKSLDFFNKTEDLKFGKYKASVFYKDESPFLIKIPEKLLNNIQKNIEFDVLVRKNGECKISGVFAGEKFRVMMPASDSTVLLPFGEINLIKREPLPNNHMTVRVVLQHPLNAAKKYLGGLDIKLVSKTSSVAEVKMICLNANQGKDFVKEFVHTYNSENINEQMELANKTYTLIDNHIKTLSDDLSNVETVAENFRQTQGLTDIASQSDIYNNQSVNMEQRRREIESQYAIVSGLNNYIQQKTSHDQLIPSSSGIASPSLNGQIATYNNLVLERNKLSQVASSNNQAMIDLTNRIEATYSSVRAGLQNEKSNLEIQQRDLDAIYFRNVARIRAIPRQERVYADIKRQQSIKEGLFLDLLQKREEKYMNMITVEPNSKLVDNIFATGPVSPSKKIAFLASLLIGLIIPIAVIKLKDILRYQISSKEELEGIASIPVLGEIPIVAQAENIIMQENNNDSFSEMMRLLRANLLFIINSKEKKVINMLSSISGDGKSFITSNLAMSLALLDKKVLIIELDIRKPKLSEHLGLKNEDGITLYLSGNINATELVKSSGLHPNLYFINAGAIPPNPNELLAKPLLDDLINNLRNDFDFIVIDTAPVGVVSDGFLLNRLADVNLYVVRAGHTPKKYVEEAEKYFKENKLSNMYFILNCIDLSSRSYRYGYGKKYGYGYG